MFNKEESSKKRIVKINSKRKLVQIGIYLIPIMIILNNKPVKADSSEYIDYLKDHFEHDEIIVDYYNRIEKLRKVKTYDNGISDIYYNGSLIIDGKIYSLNSFYIRYCNNEHNPDFHLISIYDDCEDILTCSYEKYHFDRLIKFKDTTAFIEYLINDSSNVDYEKKTIMVDKQKLLFYINNWDGMLHDKVVETDATLQHKVLNRR